MCAALALRQCFTYNACVHCLKTAVKDGATQAPRTCLRYMIATCMWWLARGLPVSDELVHTLDASLVGDSRPLFQLWVSCLLLASWLLAVLAAHTGTTAKHVCTRPSEPWVRVAVQRVAAHDVSPRCFLTSLVISLTGVAAISSQQSTSNKVQHS